MEDSNQQGLSHGESSKNEKSQRAKVWPCNHLMTDGTKCQTVLSRKSHLRSHRMSYHDAPTPCLCDKCDFPAKDRHTLRMHCLSAHTSAGFKCKKCGKKFTLPHNLKAHEKTAHNDVRPFQCPECDMQFKKNDTLKRHLVTHMENPTYLECDICRETFTLLTNLTRHKRTQHES